MKKVDKKALQRSTLLDSFAVRKIKLITTVMLNKDK